MKVLIFGGSGMLGHKLVQSLSRTHEVRFTIRSEFGQVKRYDIFRRECAVENIDVSDAAAIRRAIRECEPEIVINAAGIIKQLTDAKNVEAILSVNSIFPHRLADLSPEFGFRLIAISTDCVFAGTNGNYAETDTPDAIDLYGQSKHWGEIDKVNCLTIRTSVIGRELFTCHGLVEWFISQRGGWVNGYSQAIYSGFPTIVFADIINDIIEKRPELSGVFHISSDPISKFELLNKINSRFGLGVDVKQFDEIALDRSLNSKKFTGATGFWPPSWDEMIDRMAADTTPYDKWKKQIN